MPKIFTVGEDYHNSRFDKWFKNVVVELPQSLIEKIIRQNKVKVNKKKIKSSYRIQKGDLIEVYEISKFKPQSRDRIIKYKPNLKEIGSYENNIIENNENFIIVNKPTGIPVQAGTKSFKNIIDILKESKFFEGTKPYIVHRIDKETSGILIIAKNRSYAQLFTSLFRIRKIHKTYLALTHGKVPKKIKTLKSNLTYFDNKKKITQSALTHIKVLKSNEAYSYVELNPITGRKHQLRKQLLEIGNPIIGDNKYYNINTRRLKNKNLMLHAYKIKFMINNVKFNFMAKFNKDFKYLLETIF